MSNDHDDGLVQDSANVLEILESCAKAVEKDM